MGNRDSRPMRPSKSSFGVNRSARFKVSSEPVAVQSPSPAPPLKKSRFSLSSIRPVKSNPVASPPPLNKTRFSLSKSSPVRSNSVSPAPPLKYDFNQNSPGSVRADEVAKAPPLKYSQPSRSVTPQHISPPPPLIRLDGFDRPVRPDSVSQAPSPNFRPQQNVCSFCIFFSYLIKFKFCFNKIFQVWTSDS